MFNILNEYILGLNDSINYSITKNYISYNIGKVFIEIHFLSNFIETFIMPGDYYDPQHRIQKLENNYNWTNNNRFDIKTIDEIEYAKTIIKQSFDKAK